MTRKAVILTVSAAWLVCGASLASAQHDQPDFSGNWTLDKAKTRNQPSQLKGYTMAVKQTDTELTVETKVEGDLSPPEGGPGGGFPGGPPDGPGGGFPGGPEGGGPPPGGPGGFPGGGPPSGLIALGNVIPSATYLLDGKETEAQVAGRMRGTAKLKARWTKDGKGLQLFTVRHSNFQGNPEELTTREKWTLSNGGNMLNVQRTVETPFGTDEVKLIFDREQGRGSKETEKKPEQNDR